MRITTGTLLSLASYVTLRTTSYVFNPRPYLYLHFILDLAITVGIVVMTSNRK